MMMVSEKDSEIAKREDDARLYERWKGEVSNALVKG